MASGGYDETVSLTLAGGIGRDKEWVLMLIWVTGSYRFDALRHRRWNMRVLVLKRDP
jgi:hypothetical protein